MEEKERVKEYDKRFQAVKQKREEDTEDRYQFVAEYVLPELLGWGELGWEDMRYDCTATEAVNLKSDGTFGNMISPHSPWFSLKAEDEDINEMAPVREWLQKAERVIYSALHRSNFYEEMPTFIRYGNGIGTAGVYIEEDQKEGTILLSVRHPMELYLEVDAWGEVSAIFRRFELTAKQALDEFGDDLSEQLKRSAEETPNEKHWFLHLIEENKDRDPDKIDSLNMRYRSVYWEENGEKITKEGGYKTWPLPVWIYSKNPAAAYGYCDTDTAKPLIQVANVIMKTTLVAAQKAVNPPSQAPREMRGKVKTNPGQITYYEDPRRRVFDVPSAANFPAAKDMILETREAIKQAYKVQHFLMLLDQEKGQMTAREVMERKTEKTTVTGSTIGRFTKVLNKILDRIFAIELDAGRIPPPPEEVQQVLSGARWEIDYLGPLAQAQKQIVETQGIIQSLEMGYQLIQMYPEMFVPSLDIIDPEEVIKEIFENHGMPQEVMRDEEEVRALRAQRQQQAQQAQQMELLEKLGKAAGGLNQKPEPGSPMEEGLLEAERLTRGNAQRPGAGSPGSQPG